MIKDLLEVDVQLKSVEGPEGPPGKIGKMGPVGSRGGIGAHGKKVIRETLVVLVNKDL